jgi:prophage antirepressor-like protein
MDNGLITLGMRAQNMEVKDFSYDKKKVRVVIDEQGNPWWIAKDVCEILGLENVSKALIELDTDEKTDLTGSNVGNDISKLKAINEPGLYHLIFKSKKDEAKNFKRWITHEVLPEIRKTGGYNAGGQMISQESIQVLSASVEKGLSQIGEKISKEIAGEMKDMRTSIEEGLNEGFANVSTNMPTIDESEKAIKRLCGHFEEMLRDKDLII